MEARGGGAAVHVRPSQQGSGLFLALIRCIPPLFFLWTAMVARGDLAERRCRNQSHDSIGMP
jgi:hypothetical protein